MMRQFILLSSLCCGSAAIGQTAGTDTENPAVAPAPASRSGAQTDAPGAADQRVKYEVGLSIAPEWISTRAAETDSIPEATAMTLGLSAELPITPLINLRASLSASARLDSDGDDPDSGSNISPGLEFSLRAARGVHIQGGYTLRLNYADVFGAHSASDHIFSAGAQLNYCLNGWKDESAKICTGIQFRSTPTVLVTTSNDPVRENHSLRGDLRFTAPLFATFDPAVPFEPPASLDVRLIGSRTYYDFLDPLVSYRRRDRIYTVDVGLQLTGLIKSAINLGPLGPWLREVRIGYAYSNRSSNIAGFNRERDTPSFLITIGRKWH